MLKKKRLLLLSKSDSLPRSLPRLIKIGFNSFTLGTSNVSTVSNKSRFCCLGNEDDRDGGNGGKFRRFRVSEDAKRGTVSKCREISMDDNVCPPLICNRTLLC